MALESIALIPSGVKATKVYSQLPVNGNGDFTFDRGTSADQTRVNKDGLIETVAQDVPRLDYLDGGCPSLLLEPATTNLITYSEDFSNAIYTLNGATISTNTILSPDGSVNADELVEDSSTGSHRIEEIVTVASGATCSCSVFVKKGDRDFILLFESNSADGAYFNIDTGEFVRVDGSPDDYKIQDYGNGWYRLSITVTVPSTSCRFQIYQAETSTTSSYTGDGSSKSYLFGCQVEELSYATSYIPTSGSTETRAAETCNGAGTTAEINSQEGVLFGEIRAIADDGTSRIISLGESTSSNNRVQIFYQAASNTIYANYRVGGSTLLTLSSVIPDITNYSKVAFRYKSGEFGLYINGLLVESNVNTTIISSGTLDRLAFEQGGGGNPFYGRVKKLSVYDQALSTTELETLTGFTSFAEMSSYLSYS